MKIYGIKKNNNEYIPVLFENVEVHSNDNEYVLNVSDYLFEAIKLLLLQKSNQQKNNFIIEFINEIDDLENDITLEEVEKAINVTEKSLNLMSRIANFLNRVGTKNEY